MTEPSVVPVVDYLRLGPDGLAWLVGHECVNCGQRYVGRRSGCARCGHLVLRDVELGQTGTIDSATTIHRAASGVSVPYTSIVVDLDGGGAVKANFLGSVPEPLERILGIRVHLATWSLGFDKQGTEAIGFGFAPEEAAI
jgi:uncharacterized OB-fold protein